MRHPRTLGTMLMVAALAGCQSATGPDDAAGTIPSVTQQEGDLRLTLSADKASYHPGESVGLTLVVTNTGSAPVTLQFSSGYQHDFVASQGRDMWKYSTGRVYTRAFTTIALDPGASATRTGSWDLTDDNGAPVAAGSYAIRGVIPTSPALAVGSLHLTIQ